MGYIDETIYNKKCNGNRLRIYVVFFFIDYVIDTILPNITCKQMTNELVHWSLNIWSLMVKKYYIKNQSRHITNQPTMNV